MFDRVSYKQNAKNYIHGTLNVTSLVSLVSIIISLIMSGPQYINFFKFDYSTAADSSFIFSLCVSLIDGIVTFAAIMFFMQFMRNRATPFQTFLDALNYWLTAVCAHLWNILWVTLWSLLLVVPGIIKMISYSQMFYILAENPNISVRKAMRMSMIMTKGYKGDLFVMGLSFLGWFILMPLTFNFIGFYTIPYINVSYINAYNYLKQQALETHQLDLGDFQ